MATLPCFENRQTGKCCLVGSTPTLSANSLQQCDNGSRLAWKASVLKGIGGSSPLCCAKPPMAANMGWYTVAGSGPDCKSGASQLGWFDSSAAHHICATVVESADTADSKSAAGNSVRVQVPLVAPFPDSPENVAPGAAICA